MATQVGEIFVNLGIRGADKTISAFTSVKSSIGQVASMSLEAKAAIVGAMYALQQMTSASGTNAQGLVNLNAALGVNIETLERYRYVAERFGSTKGAMDSAFRSLSQMTAEYFMTGQAPARLSLVAGQIKDPKFLEAMKSGDYPAVVQMLQKFAMSGINKNQILASLNSLGMGGIADVLMRGEFNNRNLSRAPISSEGMIKNLSGMQERFKDLEAHFELMRDKMVVKWGPDAAKQLDQLIPHVERLIDAFARLGKAIPFSKLAGGLLDFVGNEMDVVSAFFEIGMTTGKEGQQKKIEEIRKQFMNQGGFLKWLATPSSMPAGPGGHETTIHISAPVTIHGTISEAERKRAEEFSKKHAREIGSQILQRGVKKQVKTSSGLNVGN